MFTSVPEAGRQQKRVDDVRLRTAQILADGADVPWPTHARVESQHVDRRPGLANLVADGTCVMNAADARVEAPRQVSYEIEHHFLGAADHERVRQIDHARALHAHATWAR
ncbi:MAG: hypothetical protein DMG03_00545 [Acidobacteria bacterium]|nr:MAG: hypothetical protein DMG03_00545 [Acidobacteriota bacterium]